MFFGKKLSRLVWAYLRFAPRLEIYMNFNEGRQQRVERTVHSICFCLERFFLTREKVKARAYAWATDFWLSLQLLNLWQLLDLNLGTHSLEDDFFGTDAIDFIRDRYALAVFIQFVNGEAFAARRCA